MKPQQIGQSQAVYRQHRGTTHTGIGKTVCVGRLPTTSDTLQQLRPPTPKAQAVRISPHIKKVKGSFWEN